MSTIVSILAALLLLSILVTIHELGHFIAGRLLGFTILEFSVGMGPILFKINRKDIQYSLRALPIGGMCRFYGEDQEVKDGRCFNSQKPWKRIVTIAAGPAMNLISALLLAILALGVYGNYLPSVYEIPETSSPAYIGGLEIGDVITAVNDKKVHEYNDAIDFIKEADSDHMRITVERNGTPMTLTMQDTYDQTVGYNRLGITITAVRVRYGLLKTIGESFHYTASLIRQTFHAFGMMVQGKVGVGDMSGFVGTVAYVSEAVRYGFEAVLQLAIIISISLAVFNILPIPALDGGRLVFLIVEAITGKALPPENEGMVHFIGLIALFGLIIFLTYNDIMKLIRG